MRSGTVIAAGVMSGDARDEHAELLKRLHNAQDLHARWRERCRVLTATLEALRECNDGKCSLCGTCCEAIWVTLGEWDRPKQ